MSELTPTDDSTDSTDLLAGATKPATDKSTTSESGTDSHVAGHGEDD
jgi:hypothetical protein